MKKIVLGVLALFCFATIAWADGLTVATVSIQPGKTAPVQVVLNNSGESYRAVLFTLTLPAGITIVKDEYDEPVITADDAILAAGYSATSNQLTDNTYRFAVVSTSGNKNIPEECGPLFTCTLEAAATLATGTDLTATLSEIKLTDAWAVDHDADDATFTITTNDGRITLDENSTIVPETSEENVKVKVLRTINANEWSTLVLPFDMTEEQVKEVFGNDVELAEYIEHEMNEEGTAITVFFDNANLAVDGLMANNPYIIRTPKDITEFTVDGVTIDPDEEGAIAEFTNGRTGSRKVVYGTFCGTYHAQTVVPENALFLSESQFWYSTGQTKMKAFRAYFNFVNVLTSVKQGAGVRISFSINEQSGIKDNNRETTNNNRYYDLQGRRVKKPGKGLYIRNGKKEIMK